MFENIENAKKAMDEFRYPVIKSGKVSRTLPYNSHAIRGEPGGKDVQSTSIFVKGFEKMKWNHCDLYSKFCTYGKILSCKVSIGADHEPLGFGYVQYGKIEEAQKAIQEVSNSNSKLNNFYVKFRWTNMICLPMEIMVKGSSQFLSIKARKEL
jgi:polyadenylate-binding protein